MLSALLWSNGCGTLAFKQSGVSDGSDVSTVSIRPVGASVQSGLGCLKGVEEFKIQTTESLQGAQFLNQVDGWISSNRSLFMTKDSGKTWERLNLNLPDDSRV